MKSISLTISKIALFVVMVFTMNVMPFIAFAAPTDNVSGYAFSDMPNSADEDLPTYDASDNHYGGHGLGFINMSGDRYGVNLGTDGKFTGYAWSEFGGYVQFNPSVGFPDNDISNHHGAQVSESCLSGLTACSVTGWIRFISASNDPQSGGWDGWVKMSDTNYWSNGVKLGAPDTARNRQMSGYAWGGDVVGWVDFSKVKIIGDWCPLIPGNQDSIPTGMIIDADGNCVPPPQCPDPLITNPAVPPVPACVCPVTLVAPVNGSCGTPNDICDNIPGIQLTPADIPAGYAQPTDGSKICPATTCVPGKPCDKCWNVDGVQLTVPSQYNAVYPVNQCVIAGCTDSQNTTPPYNPQATVDNGSCPICNANSPAWVEATQSCPICNPTVPGWVDGKCPKQPIKPVYIET